MKSAKLSACKVGLRVDKSLHLSAIDSTEATCKLHASSFGKKVKNIISVGDIAPTVANSLPLFLIRDYMLCFDSVLTSGWGRCLTASLPPTPHLQPCTLRTGPDYVGEHA